VYVCVKDSKEEGIEGGRLMRKKTHNRRFTDRYTQTFPPFFLDSEKPLQPHSSE
jgi:hypothetical protein